MNYRAEIRHRERTEDLASVLDSVLLRLEGAKDEINSLKNNDLDHLMQAIQTAIDEANSELSYADEVLDEFRARDIKTLNDEYLRSVI